MDVSYEANEGMLTDSVSSRMHDLFEPVLCTYIDLDTLIETCGLSDMQKLVVTRLMQGYSFEDVAEDMQCTHQTIRTHFQRAVNRIVNQNNESWMKTYKRSTEI